jgi:hypothetical protein
LYTPQHEKGMAVDFSDTNFQRASRHFSEEALPHNPLGMAQGFVGKLDGDFD